MSTQAIQQFRMQIRLTTIKIMAEMTAGRDASLEKCLNYTPAQIRVLARRITVRGADLTFITEWYKEMITKGHIDVPDGKAT